LELTTLSSEDGETMLLLSNGTSMEFPKLSRTTIGNPILLIFNPMEVQITSDALPPTQDGGKCSDSKTTTSSTREERLWK